ncbi:MAG TPA: hypothetical protein VK753_08625, partial [Xanthomonadaceae bacterium]|nr:hypothetical protein [Xanthomonadaceae bacterium]
MIVLTPNATTQAIVNVIDGACLDPDRIESMLAVDGIVLAHALSPAHREGLLGGRALAFCADARLSPSQFEPLREAAAAFADDHGALPEAALPVAMLTLRDGLMRALTADSGLSLTITAASRRFGVCLHLQGDRGEATLNAAGLGLGVWSLRCQQPLHVPVLRADARAAQGLDYCRGSGEEGLPAIAVPCGERLVGGAAMWLVVTAR